MRENEVVKRYRLSPERIRWLVALLEDKHDRHMGRNFPLSAETQVSVVEFWTKIILYIGYGQPTISQYENKNFFVSFITTLPDWAWREASLAPRFYR